MKENYLFAPASMKLLSAYAAQPRGSLFLSGVKAENLEAILDYLLEAIYTPHKLQAGWVYRLSEKNIDSVRSLLASLAQTRFDSTKPRMIVITDCEELDILGQNTILKALEEPPLGSHFILTSNRIWQILPTILSRCQLIQVKKPLKQDLLKHYDQEKPELLQQAYWATDGWPDLMHAYLKEPEHILHEEIKIAKELLQLNLKQRMTDLLQKTASMAKEELAQFLAKLLNGLYRTTRAALLAAASRNEHSKAQIWCQKFLTVNNLKEDFQQNLNHKIIVLNLCLKL